MMCCEICGVATIITRICGGDSIPLCASHFEEMAARFTCAWHGDDCNN